MGRNETAKAHGAAAYKMRFEPIILKALTAACSISQAELASAVSQELGLPVSRPTINLVLNRGYFPQTLKVDGIDRHEGFVQAVERVLSNNARAGYWLTQNKLDLKDIWNPLGKEMRRAMPEGHGKRIWAGRGTAMAPGDPLQLTISWEVEMISQEALKHFRVFRNPFIDDVQKDSDIYMSEEHRYIEAAMLDAARHGGFLAVIGEVGSGKSVMRRKVVEQLRRDGDTLVIYPQMIDKTRLSAGSVCDAIIQDISSERCRVKLEDKTRQVQRLLLDRAKSGYRHVLIIEEAHDLSVRVMKYLKRFYELEDGYRKLLGIILIGQSELKHMFNEGQNVDMREVIRRVQVAEIRGLNGNLKEYLTVKFKRVGRDVKDIFTEDAYDAFSKRMMSASRDGKTKISHAYPLLVNNYAARAMNMACDMGEPLISADVVMAI